MQIIDANPYGKLSHGDFVRIVGELMDEEGKPSALLSIPGIWEVVSEHYNNEALDRWEQEQNME